MYGTEIWHYTRKRFGPDLFTRAYRGASQVTFYSDRLMSRAFELGLGRRDARVIYPPVGAEFVWHGEDAQANEREALGIANRHMLLNVKRLHPLAGQRILIEAMADVLHAYPDTRLIICGEGALARGAAVGRPIGRRRAARDVRGARGQRDGRALLRRGGCVRAAVEAGGAADRGGGGAGVRHAGGVAATTPGGSS